MNILSSVKVLHKTALFGSAKGVCFGQQLDDTGYFPSAAVVPLETYLKCIKTFHAQTSVCMYIYWHGRVCLEPRLRVWAQAAGAKGALCTCCRSRCCISRLGSCDGQWELMALVLRKTVSLPSSFLFLTEPMAIKNARPLPGYWLYHGKCQMYSSPTVQNGNPSFLDYQRLRALFHLLLVTFFLVLSTHPCLKR